MGLSVVPPIPSRQCGEANRASPKSVPVQCVSAGPFNRSRKKCSPFGGVKIVSNSNKSYSKTWDKREGGCVRWESGWVGNGLLYALQKRKEKKCKAPLSAYKYSINFSRFHNGMAVHLDIHRLQVEMKLLWRWRWRWRWCNGNFLSSNFLLFRPFALSRVTLIQFLLSSWQL